MSKTASEYAKERRARVRLEIEAMPKIPCACGCGTLIAPMSINGQSCEYKRGHGRKGKKNTPEHNAKNTIGDKPLSRDEIAKRHQEKRQAEIALMPKIACECGCGELIASFGYEGRPRRYAYGHSSVGKKRATPAWNRIGDKPLTRAEIAKRAREKRYAEIEAMPKIPCKCGCGEMITPITKQGLPCDYAWGHNPGNIRTTGTDILKNGYGVDFTRSLRAYIRERDKYTCQRCGITQAQFGRTLDVHHLDHNKLNNDPRNLVCACQNCNTWASFHRDEPFIPVK